MRVRGVVARSVEARVGVEDREQGDLLSPGLQPGGEPVGEHTAEGPAEQMDRAVRLHLADLCGVVVRDVLQRGAGYGGAGRSVQAAGLQGVHRVFPAEMAQQTAVAPAESGGRVHAEQRCAPARRTQRQHDVESAAGCLAEALGEGGDGGRGEQRTDARLHTEHLPHPSDQPGREQRVAAQIEEVVVDTDPVQAEDVGEEPAQHLLPGRTRGAGRVGAGRRGRGKRPPVELAVRGEREPVEHDDGRRDHGVGQMCGGVLAQGLRVGVLARSGYDVADEPVLAQHDLRVAYGGVAFQYGGHLARFDPLSAQFHLVVGAARVLQRPVVAQPGQVAGAVQAGAGRAVGVGDEPLGRAAGLGEVAASQLAAPEVQLTGDADRHRPQRAVQDVGARVPHRPADGHRVASVAPPGGDVDGCLGRSVQVVQAGVQGGQAAGGQLGGQGLAAADHPGQAGAGGCGGLVEEGPQHRRHEVDGGDTFGGDQRGEVGGVTVAVGAGHHQGGALEQRPEELPDGDVEAGRGLLEHPVLGGQTVRVLHPGEPVDDALVRDDDALGPARRSGGVQHIRRVPGTQPAIAEVVAGARVRRTGRLGAQGDPGEPAGQLGGAVEGEDDVRGGLLGHEAQPLRRLARVQRQVGAARLEHGKDGDDEFDGAGQGEPHQPLGADAVIHQAAGQPVGAGVEFAVRHLLALEDDRRAGGRAGRLVLEQPGQAQVRHGVAGVVPVVDDAPFLGGVEQPYGGDRRVRGGGEPGEHLSEPGHQVTSRVRREEVGAMGDAQPQPFAGHHHQGQRVVGGVLDAHRRRQHVVGAGLQAVPVDRVALEDNQCVEQSVEAGPAGHLGERTVLVAGECRLLPLHARQQGRQGLRRVEPDTDRQGVDEQPDHLVRRGNLGRPAGDDRAEDDVVLAGGVPQQGAPGALHDRVERRAVAPGERRQVGGDVGGQQAFGGLRKHRPAGRVGRGHERPGGKSLQRLPPCVFGGGRVPVGQPGQIVPVGRRGRELPAGVEGEQLAHRDRQRPTVQQDVVVRQDKTVFPLAGAHQRAAQQRPLGGVERAHPVRGEQPVVRVLAGLAQVRLGPRHGDRARHHLRGHAGLAEAEGATQVRVPAQQGLDRAAQPAGVDAPAQGERQLDVVDLRPGRVEQGVEEQPFLQRGQREDVLDP